MKLMHLEGTIFYVPVLVPDSAQMEKKVIVFIVNSKAGGGRAGKIWPGVEERAREMFAGSCRSVYSKGPSHATELARKELSEGADVVVAVGGDGTLNEVVNGFFDGEKQLGANAALGVLSFGTGADFIRSIDWPKDPLQALNRLQKNKRRRIDVGKGKFIDKGKESSRYFINIAEFGVGGAVVDKVNSLSKKWGGKASFLWGILSTMLRFKNQEISYRCDESSWCTEVLNNSIIANGRYFGSGILPAPQAKLDDGFLDLVTFGDVGFLKSALRFPRLKKGEHLAFPEVGSRRVRKICARSKECVLVEMDGELVGRLPAEFEIIPGALDVCV